MKLVKLANRCSRECYIRLFLFHTAFASGAAPAFPPFGVVAVRGAESRRPLPDFATSRGLGVEDVRGAAGSEVEPVAPLSPSFTGVAPLAARKVLLTDTALKVVGFLTVEVVRKWPFSSV